MGQPIVQAFFTSADLSGIKQMSAGQKTLRSDMAQTEVAAARSSSRVGDAFGKLQQPLKREVFRSIAYQVVGASSSLDSMAGRAASAQNAMEVLGRVALGFSGTIGLVVLGVAALVSILKKLSDSSKLTTEQILQDVDALRQKQEGYSQTADKLLKLNLITKDEAKVLRESANASQDEINKIKDSVRTRIKGTEARIQELKALEEHRRKLGLLGTQTKQVKEAEDSYRKAVQLSAGFLNNANKTLEQRSKQEQNLLEVSKMETLAMIESMGAASDYNGLLILQKSLKLELAGAEQSLIDALKSGDQAAIDSAKTRIDSVQAQAAGIGNAMQPLQKKIQETADVIVKFGNIAASSWEYVGDRMVFSTERFGSQVVKATGDALAKVVAMEAAVALATGNFGKFAALTAASVTISTIAGAASSYLEHEASRTPTRGGGGGQTANADSGGNLTQTSLYVKIEGGYFDDRAAQSLAKRLSDMVQRNNVRLVSSSVQPSFGVLP